MHIAVRNLSKSYTLGSTLQVKALKDVSFDIEERATVSIVGPSGAGKSTLLHLLGLMDRPTSGSVMLDGAEVSTLPEREHARIRRDKIGFLFQLHYLLPEFTVWENVLIPVWEKRDAKRDQAAGLLDQLGLSERLSHLPSELSGGEQQRVALARALINDPALLLADEPTGNLDRETGSKVETIIFEECRKRQITLILVTHNPELAVKSERIIAMRDGAIESQRKSAERS